MSGKYVLGYALSTETTPRLKYKNPNAQNLDITEPETAPKHKS